MVAVLLGLKMWPGEDIGEFVRRRMTEAGRVCRRQRLWSERVAQRIVNWDAHLRRGHCSSWASQAYAWRNSSWYRARRVVAGSASVWAGRLGLRESAGRPRICFEEGADAARELPMVVDPLRSQFV